MITDSELQQFELDGAVTIDTPLTSQQITEASQLMDRLLPVGPPRPGEKNPRYRVGKNNVYEPAFTRIIEQPFFESVAKRLLHTDSVVINCTAIRNTHPQPGANFEVGEHTDMTLSLMDLTSPPRRMNVGLFVWITDVDETSAPLMVRPGRHRQLAQSMGNRPQYIYGPWEKDQFANVPDAHTLPIAHIGRFPNQWPDLEFAEPVPCVARAGQVTVLNPATIHGASTNVGQTNRKSLLIIMQPRSIALGESRGRCKTRRAYLAQLTRVLAPNRRHIAMN